MKTPSELAAEALEEGTRDIVETYIELKRMEAELSAAIERLKPEAVEQFHARWGKEAIIKGAVVTRTNGRKTWSYDHDGEFARLSGQLDSIKKDMQAAAQFADKHPGMEFSTPDGVVIAPARYTTSADSISIKFI